MRRQFGSLSNIHVIPNFVDEKDLQSILSCARSSNYSRGRFASHSATDEAAEIEKVIDSIERRSSYEFGVNLSRYDGNGLFNKWEVGDNLVQHIDSPQDFEQFLGSGAAWPPSVVLYSSILYLNGDYDGGEIRFTQHGVSVKPKAGTLLIFPSTDMYPHEVMQITSGTRFTFTLFLSNKDMIDMFKRLYAIADGTHSERGNDEI